MTNIFIGLCLLLLFNSVISLCGFLCPLGIVSISQSQPHCCRERNFSSSLATCVLPQTSLSFNILYSTRFMVHFIRKCNCVCSADFPDNPQNSQQSSKTF